MFVAELIDVEAKVGHVSVAIGVFIGLTYSRKLVIGVPILTVIVAVNYPEFEVVSGVGS